MTYLYLSVRRRFFDRDYVSPGAVSYPRLYGKAHAMVYDVLTRFDGGRSCETAQVLQRHAEIIAMATSVFIAAQIAGKFIELFAIFPEILPRRRRVSFVTSVLLIHTLFRMCIQSMKCIFIYNYFM